MPQSDHRGAERRTRAERDRQHAESVTARARAVEQLRGLAGTPSGVR